MNDTGIAFFRTVGRWRIEPIGGRFAVIDPDGKRVGCVRSAVVARDFILDQLDQMREPLVPEPVSLAVASREGRIIAALRGRAVVETRTLAAETTGDDVNLLQVWVHRLRQRGYRIRNVRGYQLEEARPNAG